jgi:peptidase E
MPKRILLGPQRPVTNLRDITAVAELPAGAIATISAAWQEDEAFTDELGEVVGRPLHDLRLYHRADQVFASDANLHAAYRERQDRLMELQRLYRARLRQLMIAARHVQRSDANAELLEPELRHAIAQLRALDRHHQNRVEAVHANYAVSISAGQSEALAEQRAAIADQLAKFETVLITGGNVVVLLNRLRLFGLSELLRPKHLVGWAAGAMVLADRVVLYHDHTPQRRRDPEILAAGLGLLPGFVFLPDAKHRLKGKDDARVSLLCRRFAPATCVTLDSGSMLHFEDADIRTATEVRRLSRNNGLVRIRTS